jgi:hypothetical protein
MNKKAAGSSRRAVSVYQIKKYYIPEDHKLEAIKCLSENRYNIQHLPYESQIFCTK